MSEHTLTPAEGSTRNRKRRGRGHGSGLGKTAGRGHKGYHSRSGSKRMTWYEGGQMPLQRRIPKRGFSNYLFRKEVQIVNLSDLARLDADKIGPELLKAKGLVDKSSVPVKILGNGELDKALEVSAHKFSQAARQKIEQAGGKVIEL